MCFWDCRSCRKRERHARIMDAVRTEQNFRQAMLFVETTKQRLALLRSAATALTAFIIPIIGWVYIKLVVLKEPVDSWIYFIPFWFLVPLAIALVVVIVRHIFLTREMRCPQMISAGEDAHGES